MLLVALIASTSRPFAVVTWPRNERPFETADGKPSKTISFNKQPVTTTETDVEELLPILPKAIEAVVDRVLKAPLPVPMAM